MDYQSESTPAAGSAEAEPHHSTPFQPDLMARIATVLNKSASETDLLRTPTYVSQRNKRTRTELEDTSNHMDDFKEEMRKLMMYFSATQARELKQLNTALKEIQQSNYNIEGSVSYLTAQNEEFKQRIVELEAQSKQDRTRIIYLENKLEELQMCSRKACFEIKNVPKKSNENKDDLVQIVLSLGKSVDCNIFKSDINDIYRVRPKNASNKNSPIVVETRSTLLKNDLLKSAKSFNVRQKNKLCAKHVGLKTNEDTPIFLGEHLTPKAARLFFLARDLAKIRNYRFCWTAYGKVYVRENEQSPIILITSESQIHQLTNAKQQESLPF